MAFSSTSDNSSVVHPGGAQDVLYCDQIDYQCIHMRGGPSWCPRFTIFTFVLAPPALSLFIVLHNMVCGSFPPDSQRSSGGTGVTALSTCLHLRGRSWSVDSGSHFY